MDQGGLGIVDPLQQSKALIAKLVIRGLLPGSESWKQLLFYELQRFCPKTGGDWRPTFRWLFREHNELVIAIGPQTRNNDGPGSVRFLALETKSNQTKPFFIDIEHHTYRKFCHHTNHI